MRKQDVIGFFDARAAVWDAEMIRHDHVIEKILDGAGVKSDVDVLDVACGTGVLIPDYLSRGVASVTGVDISSEMIKIAREKFPQENVRLICGDIEELVFDKAFDCIMVYNAFPHFPDPEKLIEKLSTLLKPKGTLTVAHGMSKAEIDRRHKGAAERVSVGLMEHDALAELFARYLTATVKISDDTMYQVTGRKS